MNYTEALKYLDRFTNFEKQPFFSKDELSLEKPRALFTLLDIDHSTLRYIHIAGTKGKGSTAQFCASILASSGYKVGLYTSPHLVDFRERIKILSGRKEAMIAKQDLAGIVADFQSKLLKNNQYQYTYFEITTALAIAYFIKQKVDYVVLETGLGGRLDATNIVTPLVSVLTPIDFDHQHILGKTISAIAREKSGIIKEGGMVVSGVQDKEALRVIEGICRKRKAKLYLQGVDFFVSNITRKGDIVTFDFSLRNATLRGLAISLKGLHQAGNAALACAALSVLGKSFDFKDGLRKAKLLGRFSIVNKKPLVVLDVAHNDISFKKLADNLNIYFPDKKVILIFTCARDKNASAMLGAYPWHKVIFAGVKNPRLFMPEQLRDIYGANNTLTCGSLVKAWGAAVKIYDQDCLILIAGSFLLAAEFLRARKLLLER